MPHGHCYLWNPAVVWLHVISDALIALAYYSIPFTLVYFVRRRKDLAFHWIFLCFAVFIMACGTTHLMEIWSVWKPTYWLSGGIKALTALTSVPTAILLIGLVPKALALPSPEQLRKANQALEKEISDRKEAEARLAGSAEKLEVKNKQLIAAEKAKGEFFANVSHEFRTPLTLILAPLEDILEKAGGAFSLEQRNSLRTVHNNAVRLLQMVTGLLDGTVSVESASGKGSVFTVECAAASAESPGDFDSGTHLTQRYAPEPVPDDPASAAAAGGRPRVLIAEDNLELAFYIASVLREFSETKIAADGDGALKLVREWSPHLVLADVMMPKLDGARLCRELKADASTARTPVVLLTALTHREALLKGWEAGADEYLFKPFHRQELVTRVRSILRASEVSHRIEESLRKAKDELEDTVEERTLDLARANRVLRAEIEERNRIEVTLRDSEERYRSLVETLPEVVVLLAVGDATILALNMPFEKKTGWPRTDWVGRHYSDLVHRDDIESAQAAIQQASRGEWPARLEIRFRCQSGEYLLGEVVAGPHFQKGRVTGVFACIRDITQRSRDEIALRESEERFRRLNSDLERRVHERTAQLEAANRDFENEIIERKLAEALLRESEERFRLLVLHVKDYAIYWIDPDGRVAGWNQGAERIKGYQASEIIGLPYSVFHTADDTARGWPAQLLKIALEHGRVQDEGWRLRKDGTRFWANTVITALRDANGQLRGFAKITRDDTERQQSQQALQESKRQLEAANQELEAFSYSVSHDLRAPLRAIGGFTQALQEDHGNRLDDTGQDLLQRVRDATRRMGHLIDGLLTLARVTRTEMSREAVNLSGLAQSILDELRQIDPEREIETAVQPGVTAWGDARLLRSALQNLLGNAWKFSRNSSPARIEFGMTDQQGHAALFVRDNGAGFDMAYGDKLFGAFQRLHPRNEFEGTGIGLATVQRIIHRHGGLIWAESTPGEGAAFYFTLSSTPP